MIKDTLLRYLYESNHLDFGTYSQSTMCRVLNVKDDELLILLETLQGAYKGNASFLVFGMGDFKFNFFN